MGIPHTVPANPVRLLTASAFAVSLMALSACGDGVRRPEAELGLSTPAPVNVNTAAPIDDSRSFGFPALRNPFSTGSNTAYGSLPVEEATCRTELKRLGVVFEDAPSIDDGGVCRIDHPISVSGFSSGKVRLQPRATLNCAMTLSFARWVRGELVPSARLRYLSGIDTIHQASSYSCRTMNNKRGAKMSEHSRGNALDISRIVLNNGKEIDVEKPGLFSFRQRGLLNTIRADACDYFTTVLGPGQAYHGDHFHFDIMQRRNGYRACR
ncbi:MAG: extensin family protein [Phyllobacterium sp.]